MLFSASAGGRLLSLSHTAVGQGPENCPLHWRAEHQEGLSTEGEVSFPLLVWQTPWVSPMLAASLPGSRWKRGPGGGAEGVGWEGDCRAQGGNASSSHAQRRCTENARPKQKVLVLFIAKSPFPLLGKTKVSCPCNQRQVVFFCLLASLTACFSKQGLFWVDEEWFSLQVT